MLNDEICKLRHNLNESIVAGDDYSITYKLSIELDELIAKYYRKNQEVQMKESCVLADWIESFITCKKCSKALLFWKKVEKWKQIGYNENRE